MTSAEETMLQAPYGALPHYMKAGESLSVPHQFCYVRYNVRTQVAEIDIVHILLDALIRPNNHS